MTIILGVTPSLPSNLIGNILNKSLLLINAKSTMITLEENPDDLKAKKTFSL